MHMICPILRLVGDRPGFRSRILWGVTLYRCARLKIVSPALMVYEKELVGQVGGGAAPGMQMICPTRRLLGSTPGFRSRMLWGVTLYRCARLKSVSPALMVYEKELAGQVGGGAAPGMQMICPTRRLLGSTLGFKSRMLWGVTLYRCARLKIVSPALMV